MKLAKTQRYTMYKFCLVIREIFRDFYHENAI